MSAYCAWSLNQVRATDIILAMVTSECLAIPVAQWTQRVAVLPWRVVAEGMAAQMVLHLGSQCFVRKTRSKGARVLLVAQVPQSRCIHADMRDARLPAACSSIGVEVIQNGASVVGTWWQRC